MNRLKRFAAVSLMALFLTPIVSRAEDPAPAKPWKNETELSFVSANGNTKSTTGSGKNKFSYERSKTKLDLEAGALGAKSAGSVVAEQYNASEKVSYKLSDRNYAFERFGWDKDRFAGISNRYDSSIGLGRDILDRPNDKLLGEVGGGWIEEHRKNDEDKEFGSGRAYLKYQHTISPTANFTQDAEYTHNFEDPDDFRVKTETAIIAGLSSHLSLKAAYIWKHVGVPPPTFSRNDTLTTISLIAVY